MGLKSIVLLGLVLAVVGEVGTYSWSNLKVETRQGLAPAEQAEDEEEYETVEQVLGMIQGNVPLQDADYLPHKMYYRTIRVPKKKVHSDKNQQTQTDDEITVKKKRASSKS